jgi:hypothetical protein
MLWLFFYQLSVPDGVVGPHGGQWGWAGPQENLNLNLNISLNLGKI